jgi:hypothetical protein
MQKLKRNTHNGLTLIEAMRLGLPGTEQFFNGYMEWGENAAVRYGWNVKNTCALGAAILGQARHLDRLNVNPFQLIELFTCYPELTTDLSTGQHSEISGRWLYNKIAELNDEKKMSREAIIEWLDTEIYK